MLIKNPPHALVQKFQLVHIKKGTFQKGYVKSVILLGQCNNVHQTYSIYIHQGWAVADIGKVQTEKSQNWKDKSPAQMLCAGKKFSFLAHRQMAIKTINL
eukprot:TRINITY_DN30319_c0_g1_i2.p6 TRINITY_DN30319_c0_g1~~TRINITY_DN30319_c0_g1_i2.p6  ORF type:complete len:100 (-),score=0.11 TRINITY_DN30319_c0_g1_i2:88-387(-)